MIYFLIVLSLVIAAIWLIIYLKTKKERQWIQEAKEQTAIRLKELDNALAEWLVVLKLPQFEEETLRKEAAIQLRIVLIEKLLLQQVLY